MDLLDGNVKKAAAQEDTNPVCHPALTIYECGHARQMPPACNTEPGHNNHNESASPTGSKSANSCIDCQILVLLSGKHELKRQMNGDRSWVDGEWFFVREDLQEQAQQVALELVDAQEQSNAKLAKGIKRVDLTEELKGKVRWEGKRGSG